MKSLRVIFVLLSLPFFILAREKMMLEKDSPYHHIVVSEEDGVRYLKFGNQILQSAVYLDDPISLKMEYTKYMPLGLAFTKNCSNLLLIGLGGGAIPRMLHYYCPGIKIEVVEIDPMVVEIAQKYFFVEEDPGYKIIIMDGRVFIKKSTKKYDIIMLDAYNCDSIPFHMTTIEFLREVKSHLNEGGLVVANLWSSDWELYLSMVKTYSQVFPHLYRFNVAGENNVVLIAGETELSPYAIVQKATLMKDKYLFTYDYARIATHLDSNKFDLSHFKILTDDYAPVDWLQNKGK